MIRQHAMSHFLGLIVVVICLFNGTVSAEDYSQQRTLFKQLYQQALNGDNAAVQKKT